MMPDVLYNQPPECDGLTLSTLPTATHRKQVMYAGQFSKVAGGKKQKFTVTAETMDYWAKTGNLMLSKGVAIPMPLEHRGADNPELRRGTAVQFERGYDSKGRDSLFVHFNFKDDVAAKDLAASDVSIFVPDEWTATDETTYKWPIRHIAFTDYPVIPGLDPAEALAASYDPPAPERDMALRDLAKKLGVKVADDATDEQVEAALEKKYEEATTPPEKPAEPPAPKPETTEAPKPAEEKKAPALAAGFVKMAAKNREHEINDLVKGGNITPAAAEKLRAQFSAPEKVSLSLSEDGNFNDGFDDLIEALKENKAISLGERSGGQVPGRTLEKTPPEDNPLHKDAKRRAEAAKAR